MIIYDTGKWGINFIFQLHGSVFPQAACWAVPNAVLAFVLHSYFHPEDPDDDDHITAGFPIIWSSYTFVLGFLVVFRNNQAYTRFWEGCTSINQVRGEWFNAISSLVAFCNKDPSKDEQVEHFQNILIRLGSLMYCSALQQVCDKAGMKGQTLEVIDLEGLDEDSMQFLDDANDRCEIILQWIQRLVVDADETGILKIAPPILSRAYQEFSRGIVHLNNVRKIKEIPFPFPYAQMITCMLLIHWAITPVVAAMEVSTAWGASLLCFCVIAAFWSLIYIALEIDQPFGTDANDVPITSMQVDFNTSLLQLLEPFAQKPPKFKFDPDRKVVRRSIRHGGSLVMEAGAGDTAAVDASFARKVSPEASPRTRPQLPGHTAFTHVRATLPEQAPDTTRPPDTKTTHIAAVGCPEQAPDTSRSPDTKTTHIAAVMSEPPPKRENALEMLLNPTPPHNRDSEEQVLLQSASVSQRRESEEQMVLCEIESEGVPSPHGRSAPVVETLHTTAASRSYGISPSGMGTQASASNTPPAAAAAAAAAAANTASVANVNHAWEEHAVPVIPSASSSAPAVVAARSTSDRGAAESNSGGGQLC